MTKEEYIKVLSDRCVSVQIGELLIEAISAIEIMYGCSEIKSSMCAELLQDLYAIAEIVDDKIHDTASIAEAMDNASVLLDKILKNFEDEDSYSV